MRQNNPHQALRYYARGRYYENLGTLHIAHAAYLEAAMLDSDNDAYLAALGRITQLNTQHFCENIAKTLH